MNWVSHFETNRRNRRSIPWERGINVEPHVRGPLVHSLQRFQIGESGEGRHMKRCAARTGDAAYAQAVHLFIAEEQQHSAWMASALELLGAPLLERHWSDIGFIALRRMMGLTCEVMTLLAAEVVGRNFFRVVHRGVDDPVLRTMFAAMIVDEEAHIAFQADRLRTTVQALPRWAAPIVRPLLRGLWWGLYHAALAVVVVDHRRLFRALCVSSSEFLRECDATFHETTMSIFHRPALAPAVGPGRAAGAL